MDEYLALEPININDEIVYVNKFGELWRWKQIPCSTKIKFTKIITKPNKHGYICPSINYKKIYLHRIIAAAFLGLDMTDTNCQVDHIDKNKSNNRLENLRLVNNQKNAFNQKAKGYSWNKPLGKWTSSIVLDGKQYHLGCYVLEQDARQAYLEAKTRYHIID